LIVSIFFRKLYINIQ